MAPSKKSTSRATAAVTSKGKSVAFKDTGAINPPTLSGVLIEDADLKFSHSAIIPEVGMNLPEVQYLTEGQLSQMFTNLQKQLEEQREETVREREQAALERDGTTCV